jgi:hypothetical protein
MGVCMPPSAARTARNRLGGTLRQNPGADVSELRHDLEVAKLEDHIRKIVDSWPPLTPAQRDRLALLLHPAGTSDGAS